MGIRGMSEGGGVSGYGTSHSKKGTNLMRFEEAAADLKASIEDVINAGYKEGTGALARVVSILGKEPFLAAVQTLPDVDFETWFAAAKRTGGSMVGSGHFTWPIEVSERVAMQLALLRIVVEGKVDLNSLNMHFYYSSTNFNANYQVFLNRLFRPFVRDLTRILEKFFASKEAALVEEQNVTNPIAAAVSKNVFIVHGHDDALKQEVARYIEKLGLNAIILAEQANQGRTIIEKFEAHAEQAGFAIVLLTPDDL